MLEYMCIFSKGGALLWAFHLAALKGNPINALIRTCLLEERSGDSSFTYHPPAGAPYSLKWTLHNGLGLVFVAVYQKALKLLYVDQLLEIVKSEFAARYDPKKLDYKDFEDTFRQLLKVAENQAQVSKRPTNGTAAAASKKRSSKKVSAVSSSQQKTSSDDDDGNSSKSEETTVNGFREQYVPKISESDVTSGEDGDTAFDRAALLNKKLTKRGPGGAAKIVKGGEKNKKTQKQKANRKWGGDGGNGDSKLDFSSGDVIRVGAENDMSKPIGRSRLDAEDEDSDDSDIAAELIRDVEKHSSGKSAGVFASFVRSLGVNVVGTAALTRENIQPALEAMKKKLMERNVAEEIAEKLCESVAAGVVGQALGSFTRVSTVVLKAFEDALTRILTPKRSIDVLREVRAAKARGKPYVVVFVGVNGVGKSTNLAKVAYWLQQNDVSVMIAACDTFRSGAVEQLKTHCLRLDVPLYERGYEKDPAKVASEAVRAAQAGKKDVVLVDTAGRMQDNEPLMRALSSLINVNQPDLVLFVGEALVGNDAVDQLSKFNQRLADLSKSTNPQIIDGIVLTKFDTIDDKVGAALSMVYTSGAPIMFVGCGQTYVDLKRLNVKQVVRCLLK